MVKLKHFVSGRCKLYPPWITLGRIILTNKKYKNKDLDLDLD